MPTEPSRGKEIRILGRGHPITIFPLTAAGFSIMRVGPIPSKRLPAHSQERFMASHR